MKRVGPRPSEPEGKARTAFVLSGGGSLGAVQVGMLQALIEAGIRPDLLIGTSVGAVNAAWIGGKPDRDGALQLGEVWRSLRRQDIFPLSPWSSARGLLGRCNHVISNASLGEVLRKNLPYQRLEEAAVPVHVIATELKSGRPVLMSTGPAVPALLASTAIPGIFPPVTIGRRDFIDGGVANHTPISAALELGASRIFVLPVGYPWLQRDQSNALGMMLHALARFIEQKLDAEVAAYRHLADIQVLPTLDAPAVSPADFNHTDELITRGYRSCRKYLASTPKAPTPAAAKQLVLAAPAAQAA
ncbi:MAG TPA: patatin-like phospholipase family protein [Candidatus Dormibacteraeota bacterium]|nr:patatin-like phospholipase family protein [Candidatus Dormibacteraeota bacterium]